MVDVQKYILKAREVMKFPSDEFTFLEKLVEEDGEFLKEYIDYLRTGKVSENFPKEAIDKIILLIAILDKLGFDFYGELQKKIGEWFNAEGDSRKILRTDSD
jgi:hypothetical protein